MITVKKLKTILEEFPDEATISAYEGEDVGINVRWINPETGVAEYYFIRCSESKNEE